MPQAQKETLKIAPPAAPDGAPKGLSWNQVSSRIELGQRFKRPGNPLVIYGLAPVVYCERPDGATTPYMPTKEDMKAQDWENVNARR